MTPIKTNRNIYIYCVFVIFLRPRNVAIRNWHTMYVPFVRLHPSSISIYVYVLCICTFSTHTPLAIWLESGVEHKTQIPILGTSVSVTHLSLSIYLVLQIKFWFRLISCAYHPALEITAIPIHNRDWALLYVPLY
jgi:hypothetical protein